MPQGSRLGPLLFIIHINDLPKAILDSNTSMYADDSRLWYQSRDVNKFNEIINNDLESCKNKLMGYKLSFNAMKTQSMLISTKQKHTILINQDLKLSLKIRDHEIEIVDTTKFLGLQMDNSLDWKYHVSGLSSKVSKAEVVTVEGGCGDEHLQLIKCSQMSCISKSLWQLSPAPGLHVAELLLLTGEGAKASHWRLNQLLRVAETRSLGRQLS